MKKLNVYYALVDNMGDKLNPYVIRRLFGFEINRVTPLTCELSGIGSGLGQFTLSDKRWLASAEWLAGKMFPETYVWGTGFIQGDFDKPFYRQRMRFSAVRGELSRRKVEQLLAMRLPVFRGKHRNNSQETNIEAIYGKQPHIALGDGGILAEPALGRRPIKKYPLGIAAHYKEQAHPAFRAMSDAVSGARLIDMRGDTEEVIYEIASCEAIISSSLHALIVADSFHIPNMHIHVSDAMLGDGFKYKDYYSAYGLEHTPLEYDGKHMITIDDIVENYRVPEKLVEKMKTDMIRMFPFS